MCRLFVYGKQIDMKNGAHKLDKPQSLQSLFHSFSGFSLRATTFLPLFLFPVLLPFSSYLDSSNPSLCELSLLSHRLPGAFFQLCCLIINGWPFGGHPLLQPDTRSVVVVFTSSGAGDMGMGRKCQSAARLMGVWC